MELERLRSRLAAAQAQVVVEIEAAEAAKSQGWASTKDYLSATAGARRGAGARMLCTSRALTGQLSATWAALHAGDHSPEHAEVIIKVIEQPPVDPDPRRRAAEEFLIGRAALLDASDLHTPEPGAGGPRPRRDRLPRRAGPGPGWNAPPTWARPWASSRTDWVGFGSAAADPDPSRTPQSSRPHSSPLSASMASPPAGPDPDCAEQAEGDRDPRDHGAQTRDALVAACQRLHDTDALPQCHGTKPRIVPTVDYHTLQTGPGTGPGAHTHV
ncbi:hypothetical protein BH18ACT9_BH18ACT9_09610 [soil metagenome]